jgi:uncharacterized protein YkwD
MKQIVIITTTIVLTTVLVCAILNTAPKQLSTKAPVASVELALINDARQEEGLRLLDRNLELDASATEKCNDMVEYNYWSHNRDGKQWYEFIKMDYKTAGEILAKGFKGDKYKQHYAWMNSPTHREEIEGDYTDFGMAICMYDNGDLLTVVHFAKE